MTTERPRICVILFGAAQWPRWPEMDNEAYAHAHAQIREYLTKAFALGDEDLLDRFGSKASIDDLVKEFQTFLAGAGGRGIGTAIIYFIGHGSDLKNKDASVITARADKDLPDASSFRGSHFAEAIRAAGPRMRAYILLDACFAARITDDFIRPTGSRGVSILASSGRKNKSYATPDGRSTVFTRALLNVLERGDPEAARLLSLGQVCRLVRREIRDQGWESIALPEVHSPHQAHGNIAEEGLFPNAGFEYRRSRLDTDAPVRPWCAVVSSADGRGDDAGEFLRAVNYFRASYPSGGTWQLAPHAAVVRADEAFADARSFERCVDDVCAADLAFFDLTGHDPAILVLLGIRAVIRRGVTICSTADPAAPSRTPPFLLRDVNVIRHGLEVDRPEVEMTERALEGIRQLHAAPRSYSDLPAFDLMRLHYRDADGNTIRAYHESALVLCSFSAGYQKRNWTALERGLRAAVNFEAAERDERVPARSDQLGHKGVVVARTLDMGSPQVVSVNLFRAMRLNDLCVCDLTEWRPNVLFELGLRLACNPVPPVCVIDAPDRPSVSDAPDASDAEGSAGQRAQLQTLLAVLPYHRRSESEDYRALVTRHLKTRRKPGSEAPPDDVARIRVYDVAWRHAESAHEPDSRSVLDLLHEKDTDDENRSLPFIFPVGHHLTTEAGRETTEKLVAAWLYLVHRAEGSMREQERLTALGDVGIALSERLADAVDAADRTLLAEVHRTLARDWWPEAGRNTKQVLSYAKRGRERAKAETRRGEVDRAREILLSVIDVLKPSLVDDPSTTPGLLTMRKDVARALADSYGQLGGVERRRKATDAALAAYTSGRTIEQDPEFGIVDSYNLVNELVVRILLDPRSFGGLTDDLARAAATVREQVEGSRRDQWWAWADAALLELLVGNAKDAERDYDRFAENGPKPSDYTSVADVLGELATKLDAVEPATAGRLRGAAAGVLARVR